VAPLPQLDLINAKLSANRPYLGDSESLSLGLQVANIGVNTAYES
jgi:hypothetical protein